MLPIAYSVYSDARWDITLVSDGRFHIWNLSDLKNPQGITLTIGDLRTILTYSAAQSAKNAPLVHYWVQRDVGCLTVRYTTEVSSEGQQDIVINTSAIGPGVNCHGTILASRSDWLNILVIMETGWYIWTTKGPAGLLL